ncbi:hypothetical protein AB834_00450 [PVC group bacterium (ex Bugula neritina AB1)]|nr:hypothetical protein AB834_00450 [PVC group bacterium (ex Bugula neritina AB1)]
MIFGGGFTVSFYKYFLTFFFFFLPIFGEKVLFAQNVQAEMISSHIQASPGETVTVAIGLKMDEGWHTYAKDPGEAGAPSEIIWTLPANTEVSDIEWPPAITFDTSGIVSYGYKGQVYLVSRLKIPKTWPVNKTFPIKAKVQWLACKEICIPGQASFESEIMVSANSLINQKYKDTVKNEKEVLPKEETVSEKKGTFFLAVLFAFLGGLILNLMPCVLPVLSLKVMKFVQHAANDSVEVWKHGLVFMAGVLASFWVLTLFLILLRAGGQQLGWGFQLQSPTFVFLLTVLFFVFALNMFGIFEINFAFNGGSLFRFIEGKTLFLESFFSGILVTLVATPCTAPFMGVALGFALTQPIYLAFIIFTALGVGLAFPYVLLSFNEKWLKCIPKPGGWMIALKELMGFFLIGTCLWLIWVLNLQVPDCSHKILWAMLIISLGFWIHSKNKKSASFLLACSIVILSSFWILNEIKLNKYDVVWENFDQEKIIETQQKGRPVFVDFTAAWCLTCQVNKRTTLSRVSVRNLFKKNNILLMRADWTKKNPKITKALEKLGHIGVPLYVYYPPEEKAKPIILPAILSPKILKSFLVKRTE